MSASWGFFLTVSFRGRYIQSFSSYSDVIIQKITLMSSDIIPLSSAMWVDISGEGTSEKGVRLNFPGLGSRPSLSSHVTALSFSLGKPAVIIPTVLPGQSRCKRPHEDMKQGRVQQVVSSANHCLSFSTHVLLLQLIARFHVQNR